MDMLPFVKAFQNRNNRPFKMAVFPAVALELFFKMRKNNGLIHAYTSASCSLREGSFLPR